MCVNRFIFSRKKEKKKKNFGFVFLLKWKFYFLYRSRLFTSRLPDHSFVSFFLTSNNPILHHLLHFKTKPSIKKQKQKRDNISTSVERKLIISDRASQINQKTKNKKFFKKNKKNKKSWNDVVDSSIGVVPWAIQHQFHSLRNSSWLSLVLLLSATLTAAVKLALVAAKLNAIHTEEARTQLALLPTTATRRHTHTHTHAQK